MDTRGETYVPLTESLDPKTGRWERRSDMLTPRNRLTSVHLNGKIYAIGGMKAGGQGTMNANDVEEYDPKTNSWEKRAPMPTPRHGCAAVAVDGRILVIGGMGDEHAPGASSRGALSTVEEYDPATNRWHTLARMPTPRGFLCCAVVGGKVYAIGGHYDVRTLECYDPKTDRWDKLPTMSAGFTRLGAAAVGDAIFAVGGEGDGMAAWRYAPSP